MRTRTVAVIALLTLSSLATAQVGGRRPPTGGTTTTKPGAAPLPPEIPEVTRGLAYKRSLWTVQGYAMFGSIAEAAGNGSSSTLAGVGAGSQVDFRFNDMFSATGDLTATLLSASSVVGTAELGTRFHPLNWSQQLRPFVDVRAAYLQTHDTYAFPDVGIPVGAPGSGFSGSPQGRYSRGVGTLAGVGFEFGLTQSLGLTTELLAMRSKLTTYRFSGPASTTPNFSYWTSTYRYTIGLKYNPLRALTLSQNPTK